MAALKIDRIYDFESAASHGERIHFRFFESFVVVCAVSLAWMWAIKASHISFISAPIGLAKHVDLSFLLFPGVPFILALMLSYLCILGFKRGAPAFSYGMALLLFHLLYVLRFSLGKVGHGSNFIGMSLLGLFLGMLFFNEEYHRRRFTLGFTYMFIGFAYVFAALTKLTGTGILWSDGHHLWMWMAEKSVDLTSQHGTFSPNPFQVFLLANQWAATAILTFGLVTESLGWLMWWPRTRPWFTITVVGMHMGISLVMGIHFTLYIVELLIIGLPWPLLLDRLKLETSKKAQRELSLDTAE